MLFGEEGHALAKDDMLTNTNRLCLSPYKVSKKSFEQSIET